MWRIKGLFGLMQDRPRACRVRSAARDLGVLHNASTENGFPEAPRDVEDNVLSVLLCTLQYLNTSDIRHSCEQACDCLLKERFGLKGASEFMKLGFRRAS